MQMTVVSVLAPLVLLAGAVNEVAVKDTCKMLDVSFIVLAGDATVLALEDDIRADLAKIGINVTRRLLPKKEFNAAMVAGDFNLAFSETWGPPYDPHSYAKSWSSPDEAYYAALSGLPPPNTQAVLHMKIDEILKTETETDRETKWSETLNILHSSATELPFSGKRIPAVINNRLSGYQNGLQQFDYPIHTLRVVSGSKNITVTPGGQTGLFAGIGRLDPHSYRPNEFFSNNWVYEGLVEYGPDGKILPSLAISWTIEDISGGGQRYTFNLRQGVKFHDGADWDCSVAKLNFDHVLAPPLTTGDYHGWYGLPEQINAWNCTSTYVFEVTTKDKYYPLLQELTYIRPLRMLSPTMFVGGATSNPLTQNSCPTGWGTINALAVQLTCAGILGISGTGRWKYIQTVKDASDELQQVIFQRNSDHWAAASGDVVEFVHLIRYQDAAAVKAALIAETLDMVVGDGVLAPADLEEFRTQRTTKFSVFLTESLQNRIIIFNTAKAPTDDLTNRKIMIHAVNKADIIARELGVLAKPVDSLFPKTAPYCDIDLTPRWDYDAEKAELLNCPDDNKGKTETKLSTGAIAAIVVLGVGLLIFVAVLVFMVKREKDGQPVFQPLIAKDAEVQNDKNFQLKSVEEDHKLETGSQVSMPRDARG